MARMSRDAERKAWTDFVEKGSGAAASDAWSTPNAPSIVRQINFSVPIKAAPQGSMSGICTTKPDGTPVTILKASNPRTHPYRRAVAQLALEARSRAGKYEICFGHEIPIRVCITFVLAKPKSAPPGRVRPSVKPDLDKLTRSTMDAMEGILYLNDSQVVDDEHHKIYGTPECVHISVQLVEE